MIPKDLISFYSHRQHDKRGDLSYGEMRQRDFDIAMSTGLYEIIKLKKTKREVAGRVGVADLQYNWFVNRKDAPFDLAYVISPDARIPNYTTIECEYNIIKDILNNYYEQQKSNSQSNI